MTNLHESAVSVSRELTTREKLFISEKEKTFQYDEQLPDLPLPSLRHTLQKYMESLKPLLSPEELTKTQQIVQDFENGVGMELQNKLIEKAKCERNWLEQWWLDYAYLYWREPILPYINGAGENDLNSILKYGEDCQIKVAAFILTQLLQFWKLLRKERLKPDRNNKDAHFSMDQYKRLFNTTRIPGKEKDYLLTLWRTEAEGDVPRNVTLLCNGHIFTFEPFDSEREPITTAEIESQLQFISDYCHSLPPGPGLGALTCDERPRWYKNRELLRNLNVKNRENLDLIESSMFVMALDLACPKDDSESLLTVIAGDIGNRWADKSLTSIVFKNGRGGSNNDHTPMDGAAFLSSSYFMYLAALETRGKCTTSSHVRDLPRPKLLEFHLDPVILKSINMVRETVQPVIDDICVLRSDFCGFGKKFIRQHKLHPDAFVQLAIQLAYYRLHGRPAPTYETATTRGYYHGRTETVRSCTMESAQFSRAMLDSAVSEQEKWNLMTKAHEKHIMLMEEGKRNHGCDRHLLGLYVLTLEAGLPLHEIFTDPSWTKSGGGGNFILSTSMSGYIPLAGGCTAMTKNGYGCFYNIVDDTILFCVSTWRSSYETSTAKFYQNLQDSLLDMGKLAMAVKSNM